MRINIRGIFRDQHRDEVLNRINSVVTELRALREDSRNERTYQGLRALDGRITRAIAENDRLIAETPLPFPRRGSFAVHAMEFEEAAPLAAPLAEHETDVADDECNE